MSYFLKSQIFTYIFSPLYVVKHVLVDSLTCLTSLCLYRTHVIDEVNKKQDELGWPLTPEERFRLLDELVTRLSVGNKLNLLVWDGEYMYVHTNYRGTLHMLQKDADTLWFSTRPLDDAPWQAVPFLRLLVFREGRLVFQGEGGSQEYFDPEKDFEYKRLDFANL